MLLTVVQGTAQGVSVFAQTREKLEGTLIKIFQNIPVIIKDYDHVQFLQCHSNVLLFIIKLLVRFAGLSMGHFFLSHPILSHSNSCLSHPIPSQCPIPFKIGRLEWSYDIFGQILFFRFTFSDRYIKLKSISPTKWLQTITSVLVPMSHGNCNSCCSIPSPPMGHFPWDSRGNPVPMDKPADLWLSLKFYSPLDFATLINFPFEIYEILTYLFRNVAYYLLCWPHFYYSPVNIWGLAVKICSCC